MSIKVALGIFWDIENCGVPLNKSASSVAKHLRDFVGAAHPECGYAKEFFCVCDTRKVDHRLLEGLDKNGVVVVHVNSTAKNAADDKLQELIDMYVDKYGGNGSAVLCIITGDINFAKPIRNARRKDLDVVLIHGHNCSTDLKNLVNESYLYEDIIKGADNTANKGGDQSKPVYLEVLNLPTDQSLATILGRLSLLSANCGGKPDVLNGKWLIRFGCRDDAQRCQQRIDGENCFGHKIQVRLFDGDPKAVKQKTPAVFKQQKSCEQSSAPIAAKLKTKSLSQQNLAKSVSKSETDLTQIPKEGDDCKSIIIGLNIKGVDRKKFLQDLITSWKDKKLTPDLIQAVQRPNRGRPPHQVNPKDKEKIYVTAISPEANKLLVFRSKKYLKESGIKWFLVTEKQKAPKTEQNGVKPAPTANKKVINNNNNPPIECMSVIKGMDTKKDDNVAKIVRKIVESWNDKSVHPNYIKNVERDRKFADKDGVVLLFVTAYSPENSRALVESANRHLKPTDGFQWTLYQRKRNISRDTDTESNFSDTFEFIPSLNSSTQDLSGPPIVQKQSDSVATDDMLSVITGLETKKGDKVAKVVRRVMVEWKDPKLNGNLIKAVDRFPGFPDDDGKIPLLVTAVSPQACIALVTGSERYLDPSKGIFWAFFKSDTSSKAPNISNGLEASTAPLPLKKMNASNEMSPKLEASFAPAPLNQMNYSNELLRELDASIPPLPLKKTNASNEMSSNLEASAPPLPEKQTKASNEMLPKLEVKPQPTAGPTVRPKDVPIGVYVPQQFQILKDGPTKEISSPLFVANHFNRSPTSPTSGTPIIQSSLGSGSQYAMTNPFRSVPSTPRKEDSDNNLIKSLVSGFESLFKPSFKSPKKSVPNVKTLDSIYNSSLSLLNPIYCPTVPFNHSIVGGLTEGFMLCISGRLNTSTDCFAIDFFVNDSDIAFHFNVRLPHSLVVRNTYVNGEWGPEERQIVGFPFIVGHTFDISIKVNRESYVVDVNRQHLCDYEHRIAIRCVERLSISGGIIIDCLRTP